MQCWDKTAFYIPLLHTKPLSDKDPDCAQELNTLRQELQQLAGQPVNFQAADRSGLVSRDVLFDQPYFTLIEADEKP